MDDVNFLHKHEIEEISQEFISEVFQDDTKESHNIYEMVSYMNFKVELCEFMDDDYIAIVNKNECGIGYIIELRESDSNIEQKYSIACVLANSLIHHRSRRFSNILNKEKKSQFDYFPMELYRRVQTDAVALALLMPEEEVALALSELVKEGCNSDHAIHRVEHIAHEFKVSAIHAFERLLFLNSI